MTEAPSETRPRVIPPTQAPSALKRLLKGCVHFFATASAIPLVVSYKVTALILGPDRALEGSSQTLSLMPGIAGNFLRNAFYNIVLRHCDRSTVIEFGTLFSQSGAELDAGVYIGPRCHLGLVHLERDVLVAAGVHIPSGGKTHYFDDPTRPIREQGGERKMVTIGAGAWIGSGAVVLADVGAGTIVAAGSVVVKPLPENVIAGGVPAAVLRPRFLPQAES